MITTLPDERFAALVECSNHWFSGRFGLALAYEAGNRMNALIRWPNLRCSVVVESRSICGLSPYNNRKTAERRASCEPGLQFIRHQASGQGSQPGRAFISFKRRVARHCSFLSLEPFCVVLFLPVGVSILFFFQVSIIAYPACSCPGFQGFRPACMHYGKVERDGSIRRLLGIRMVFLPLNGGSSKLEVQKLDRRRKVSRPGYKRQSSFSVGSTDPEPSGTVTRSPFQRRGITRTNERH